MNLRRSLLAKCALLAVSMAVALYAGVKITRRLVRSFQPTTLPIYGLQLEDDLGRPLGKPHGPLKLILDPFTIYRHAPNQRTAAYTINAAGWRGEDCYPDRPKIVVLGGSAVFGQELANDGDTCCRRLEDLLGTHKVLNAGIVGYLSGQELALYVHRLRDAPADYVVAIDGWNELFDQWLFQQRAPGLLGFNNQFFEIRDRLAAFHANGAALLKNQPTAREEEFYFDEILHNYFGNILDLQRIVEGRGAKFLWVIQPELGVKASRTVYEQKILDLWNHHYRYVDRRFSDRYRLLRERAAKFAREQQIAFLDANECFAIADELFVDPVHPNRAGHSRLAVRMERALRNLPATSRLAATPKSGLR